MAQVVECLFSVHEALGSTHSLYKPGTVVHPCNPSTWKVRSGVQCHPLLRGEVEGRDWLEVASIATVAGLTG